MTPIHISSPKQSGTKVWSIVTANTLHELERACRKTGAEIHQKGDYQPPHIDLNPKQIKRVCRSNAAEGLTAHIVPNRQEK
jgi:hypothetical protein